MGVKSVSPWACRSPFVHCETAILAIGVKLTGTSTLRGFLSPKGSEGEAFLGLRATCRRLRWPKLAEGGWFPASHGDKSPRTTKRRQVWLCVALCPSAKHRLLRLAIRIPRRTPRHSRRIPLPRRPRRDEHLSRCPISGVLVKYEQVHYAAGRSCRVPTTSSDRRQKAG